MLEFHDHALELLGEISREIVTMSIDLNRNLLTNYFELLTMYTKLHLLLALMVKPEGRGKLALAAYRRVHEITRRSDPGDYAQVALFVQETEQGLPKLRDDMSHAGLHVAEPLVPLSSELLKMISVDYLREHSVLSPIAAFTNPDRSGRTSTEAADLEADGVPVLLPLVPQVKQWFIYGMLVAPEELITLGAVDMLLGILQTMYVLPIYGADYLCPHAEFEADSKLFVKWFTDPAAKKKGVFSKNPAEEEAKRFAAGLKDARVSSWKRAAKMHLSYRTALCTKLTHLNLAFVDSPSLVPPKLLTTLAALRLAQDELDWWTTHVDIVPDELPKKVREEGDASFFNPATVHELVRLAMQLQFHLYFERKLLQARFSEFLSGPKKAEVEQQLVSVSGPLQQLPTRCASLLREMPDHLANASSLQLPHIYGAGLRLNVLRALSEVSLNSHVHIASESAPLCRLLQTLQNVADLSRAVDEPELLAPELTAVPSLVNNPAKFSRLFGNALSTRPADCISIIQMVLSSHTSSDGADDSGAASETDAVVFDCLAQVYIDSYIYRKLQLQIDCVFNCLAQVYIESFIYRELQLQIDCVFDCLAQVQAAIVALVDLTMVHLDARRKGVPPPRRDGLTNIEEVTSQLCGLCAVLERAHPLDLPGGERIVLNNWLRDKLEATVRQVFTKPRL